MLHRRCRMKRHEPGTVNGESTYWFSRHAKPVIFLILTLALLGGYLAFTIPISVFPTTSFPRILIAVDNGVMPIDQMMVTITRPVEEAVNSVPGLQQVRSITSRGSAEIDLFFDWNVDMFQTLQYVNAAISRVQPEIPPTATVVANRMTFASFPIIGYSLTSQTVPQTQLWEMATYEIKPRLNRMDGVSTVLVQGGQQPEFHDEVERIRISLPPGIDIRPFYDQSIIVGDSIKSVRDAILLGLILASIILVVFLRDWGTSVVAGLVIPVTIAVTFIALKLLNQSFNLMTLGGLAAAVGLVIDDAIVVVENIVLHRDAGQGRLEAIRNALHEITIPLIGSTITPIVVFVPLISITGVTGTFFRALALTMGIALFTSLALALTWTPTLSSYFIKKHRKQGLAATDETAAEGDANASENEQE